MVFKTVHLFAIVVGMLSPVGVSLASRLPSELPQSSQAEMQISLEFPPSPNNRGEVTSSAGGGTRSTDENTTPKVCSSGETLLTALTPGESEAEITISPNPAFFFYIPETEAKEAEFVLQDEVGNLIYDKRFELPETAGIVQVSLPETVALAVDQEYEWQFIILCDPDDITQVEFVQGYIQRSELTPELQSQLETASEPLEKAELYAKERIWQDTLMTVAQLRDSYQTEWEQLLKSVGLEAIASAPITPCCSADEAETPTQPEE